MLGFLQGDQYVFIWVAKGGFEICFCRFFGEYTRSLVRATPSNVVVYRVGLGLRLGNAIFNV